MHFCNFVAFRDGQSCHALDVEWGGPEPSGIIVYGLT